MKFLELTMRNFRSYGNNVTTVKLDFDKPTLIVGKNYDSIVDGQVDSNGAGKTTILDAISVCCYDKTISGIVKGDMINYINGKNMEISLTFEKNGTFYKIVRFRANKALGGDGVKLYVNNTQEFTEDNDKTKDSIVNTNKEIESIIGIPFEIFSRIVIFSASYEPFLNLPFSHASKENQKDVFEELFGLTELSRKAESLKEIISSSKKKMEDIKKKNEMLSQERERHVYHMEQTKLKSVNWEDTKNNLIKELTEQLKPLIKIDLDDLKDNLSNLDTLTKKIDKQNNNISTVQNEINKIVENNKKHENWNKNKTNSVERLKSEISELKEIDVEFYEEKQIELESNKTILNKLNDEKKTVYQSKLRTEALIQTLKDELHEVQSGNCPYCKQEFHGNKEKIHECEEALEQFEKDHKEIESRYKELELEISNIKQTISEIPNIPNNLSQIKNNITKKTTELELVEKSENPFTIEDVFVYDASLMDLKLNLETLIADKNKLSNKINTDFGYINNLGYSLTSQSVLKIESDIDKKADKLEDTQKSTNPYVELINELEDTLSNIERRISLDELDELDSELEHQNFLLKLLTKKDSFIRKALLNKNIPFLNSRMAHYLSKIGLNHKVIFDEEMVVQISQFGTPYEYKALSSGQRARINLALVFSFRDVLQSRFDKINFYILDECLDVGLGNVGVQLATKMIKAVAIENNISMFVISHRDEISNMFDNKLEIELRNGFSEIKV